MFGDGLKECSGELGADVREYEFSELELFPGEYWVEVTAYREDGNSLTSGQDWFMIEEEFPGFPEVGTFDINVVETLPNAITISWSYDLKSGEYRMIKDNEEVEYIAYNEPLQFTFID
ncbi:hypothetical protein ACQKK5_13475 [Brevibacillus panacihumi]|uniref:hypothetical protein n=1 Tax=Brevibacillus panacihumi TaxID=497735 RepID=UPI003D04BE14